VATFAILFGVLQTSVIAIENWADSKLPVVDGLEMWLDAVRASGPMPIRLTEKLEIWHDASGNRRHVSQPEAAARPTVLQAGLLAVVRFDGVDDCLRVVDQAVDVASFTVVVVAAPRVNVGAFPAFVALNARGERDYTSGMTVDLGPWPSTTLSSLNVEGRGFGGVKNLRTSDSSLGELVTLIVASNADDKSVSLTINGHVEGSRPRDGSAVAMDEVTIGARYFNNGTGPQAPNGFLRGDIAEVLVFNRKLGEEEIKRLQEYIDAKYSAARNSLPPEADAAGAPLTPVADPPAIQMFVPGFAVYELPIELSNINNVKYREDGTLVALGYDGKIWLLRDTDGDGLEDQADLFWGNDIGLRSPIGMDLTPPGYSRGDGVFVVGKTMCLLVADGDHDGHADNVVEVAAGWKESFHQVDGLGVAIDPKDGSVYFGRGTYNFADPFLRDADGNSQLSLTDESGAVIRVSPDFKTREIVATGIRFPVAIRINRSGDLFATDQEGATWAPNGNPLDELLHVQQGRHYGFPSRHPKYLPHVIDEPSTFDYEPQHQSTCGLNFNEPVHDGGPSFGPADWQGDAFVTGYSRGKLYRTQLIKSPSGYVARTQLLASLRMLTVDACPSPDGDLVVACHSGGPDWGSGPSGAGKLFKVRYIDRQHPQPTLVWAAGPRELRVEFDRPVDPKLLRDVLAQSKLTAGASVSAGDRFESLWPGYAVVQAQKLSRRHDVPLLSAQLTPDGRTLVFATDPMQFDVRYALELPGMGRPAADDTDAASATGELPQTAAIDLGYDLTGCDATWHPADGGAEWHGWLPHVDLDVCRRLTAGSAIHDALWTAMHGPGELTLLTQIDLKDMLRPAVQPGSKLDFEYPPEAPIVAFATSGSGTLSVSTTSNAATVTPMTNGHQVNVGLPAEADKLLPVELKLKITRGGTPTLTSSWTTNEDDRPRPLPLRRLLVPWARVPGDAMDAVAAEPPPEIAGGSWARGFREFYGARSGCSKCHVIHGRGGSIGPNLSNLAHRDYASVLRDIVQPSFAINPDHLSYVVSLKDGRTLTGVVHSTTDTVTVSDSQGVTTTVPRSEVEEMTASSLSTMPEGLLKSLTPDEVRDLMTFLLTPPPSMPRDAVGERPAPRPVAEVHAALAGAPAPPAAVRPIRILLVAGAKDHGPGEHDYPAWLSAWSKLLGAASDVTVDTAMEWPGADQWRDADVVVFYQHGDWNAERAADVDAHLNRGGGLAYLHWAVHGQSQGADFAQRIGLAAGELIAFRHGELPLVFNQSANHPISRNFDKLALVDESYWKLAGSLPSDRVLATAEEDGMRTPQMWTVEHGQGRVFVSIPGHFSWTFDDPLFRLVVLRGIAWAAKEPVDRFNDLVWPGADIAQ